jgi:methylmalonyl-CoA mutase N-terminal domain/subunit
VVVGINRFVGQDAPVPIVKVSPHHEREQQLALSELRRSRDQPRVIGSLAEVREAARGNGNLLPPIREALRAYATIGEVCGTLREVFGEYRPGITS